MRHHRWAIAHTNPTHADAAQPRGRPLPRGDVRGAAPAGRVPLLHGPRHPQRRRALPARPPGRAARHAAAGLPPRHCRGSPRQPPSRPGLDCTLKGAYGDHIGERGSQDDEVAKKNSFCGIPTPTSPHLFGVQLCLGSSVRRRLSGPACHSLLPGRCCSPCLPPALHPLPPFPLLVRPSRLKTAGGTPGQGDAAECARPNRWRPSLNPLAGTEEASRIPRRCA